MFNKETKFLLIFLSSFQFFPFYKIFSSAHSDPFYIFSFFSIFLFFIYLFRKEKFLLPIRFIVVFISLFSWFLFSSLNSSKSNDSFLFLAVLFLTFSLVLVTRHIQIITGNLLNNIINLLMILALISSIFGLYQFFWYQQFGPSNKEIIPKVLLAARNSRISGMYGQPNLFALFLSLGLISFSYRYIYIGHIKERLSILCIVLSLIPIALVSFVFFQTGSRNGLLSLSLVFILGVYLSLRSPDRPNIRLFSTRVLPLFSGVLLGYLAYRLAGLDGGAVRSIVTSGEDVSIDTRLVLWFSALLLAFEHPFLGVGFANFKYFLADTQVVAQEKLHFFFESRSYTNWAHNEYLHLLAEGGLPAFFLFTTLAVWIFSRLLVGVLREGRGDDPAFVYSHLLLLPFFFQSAFSWPLRFAPLLALFAILLGCALAQGPTTTWTPSWPIRRTFQGLALCAMFLTLFLASLERRAGSFREALQQGQTVSESFTDFQQLAYNPQTRYVALTRLLPEMTQKVLETKDVTLGLRLIPFAEDLTEMERAYWQWLLLARLYHLVGLQEKAREAAEMSIHQQPVHEPAWQFLHYIDMTRAAEETGRPIESFLPDTLPASHPFTE